MQLLLDLNLSEHFDFSEEEFAACGPGSRAGLVAIFGKYVSGFELEAMRWIQANQDHYCPSTVSPTYRTCVLLASRVSTWSTSNIPVRGVPSIVVPKRV